ncbi:MAG TPA: hypothetical protein VFN02_15835, partial [Ktedonobacteraceae bacterium]|nr:hypothetical protein [Ktedonobacteraceae bacterium]
ASGFLLTVASQVFSNSYHIYQAEIFPTRMRGTAVGIAYSLSRLSSALLPLWRNDVTRPQVERKREVMTENVLASLSSFTTLSTYRSLSGSSSITDTWSICLSSSSSLALFFVPFMILLPNSKSGERYH